MIRIDAAKSDEHRAQQMPEEDVAGGDPQLPRGPQVLAGDPALEADDLLEHALGEIDHVGAAGGERIAGTAALEQARAEMLLDLAEPPEHGGMIDAEVLARTREGSRFGDRLDVAEIIPRQHATAPIPPLVRTRGMTQTQPLFGRRRKHAGGMRAA
jgi:hypothetical protein